MTMTRRFGTGLRRRSVLGAMAAAVLVAATGGFGITAEAAVSLSTNFSNLTVLSSPFS